MTAPDTDERKPAPGAGREVQTVPADERGRTTIADRVVEKIAGRAALEVAHAEGLRRSVAGRALGQPKIRAQVDMDGNVAALRLDLALEYPSPARTVTRQVREHVESRVTEWCALRIDHIDITVAVLRRPDEATRRVL